MQSPKLKRALNKVIFHGLYLNEGRVEAHRLAPVVSELVQANRPAVVYEHRSNALVAAQALSLKHNSPVRVDRAKGRTASNARTAAFGGHGWSKTAMVELRGFEPLTPSMRTRCATGLRYSPKTPSRVPSRTAANGVDQDADDHWTASDRYQWTPAQTMLRQLSERWPVTQTDGPLRWG